MKDQLQNIWELAQDEMNGERIRPNHLDLKLLANSKEVPGQSGGMSTNMNGITFHQEFMQRFYRKEKQTMIERGKNKADNHMQIPLSPI